MLAEHQQSSHGPHLKQGMNTMVHVCHLHTGEAEEERPQFKASPETLSQKEKQLSKVT